MHTTLLSNIEEILASDPTLEDGLTKVCRKIQQTLPIYDWVGFYFNHNTKQELHLKAYAGNPTEHTVIPFGKGICGQVALTNQNFVVDDVGEQDNYIACSIDVKSEIVVPLFINNKNIGQIDIDSNTSHAFSKADEAFLVRVNILVAAFLIRRNITF